MPTWTWNYEPLYDWQRAALETDRRHRLLIAGRRIGKTEVAKHAAVRALIAAKKTLWIAPVYSQIVEQYRSIEKTVFGITTHKITNKEIRTATGGQIWFRSADNPDSLRSLGVDLVIFDEFAFGSEEAWKVLRPMLVESRGRFFGISSPNGHNHVHALYNTMLDNPDWYVRRHPWSVSPHILPEEVEKAKSEMLTSEFRQEFLASFEQPKGALFDPDWLKPEDIFVKEMPTSPQRSMVGIDISRGELKSDYQGVVYIAVQDGICYVHAWAGRVPISELALLVKRDFWDVYHPEATVWEHVGFQSLAANEFTRLFPTTPPILLSPTHNVKKDTRIARLASLLSRRQLKILDDPGGRLLHAQACDWPIGDFDDLLDALELAWRALCE